MTQSSLAQTADPRRGRAYPWIFVGGMLAVVAVNAGMVALAVATFSGVDTPKPYVEGLSYNRVLQASRAQAALGWRVDLRVVPLAADPATEARAAELFVELRDAGGRPLDDLAPHAMVTRPTSTAFDRDVALEWRGNGSYHAVLELPLPGQWDLRLIANRDDDHWQAVKRLQLP